MHLPLGAEYRRSFRDIPRLFYAGRKTAVRPRNGQGNSEGSFVHANGWYHPDSLGTAEDRKPLKEPKNDPADEMPCGGADDFRFAARGPSLHRGSIGKKLREQAREMLARLLATLPC